jgi:hypothetical protein
VNEHTVEIFSHIVGGNPDRLHSMLTNPDVPTRIAFGIGSEFVRQSVDLDRDSGRFAEEIDHKRSKRMLSSEFQSLRAQPKHPPEPDL